MKKLHLLLLTVIMGLFLLTSCSSGGKEEIPKPPQTDSPGTDNPSTDEPEPDEPGTDDPSTDEPEPDEPGTDDPEPDNPGTDNPSTDEPEPDDPEPDDPEPEITTTMSGLNFTFAGGISPISFTTNVAWTLSISGGEGWCTASTTSGKAGSQEINITVGFNESTSKRKATITIKAETATQSFTIEQEARPEDNTNNPNGNINDMNWG